jgi:hypothetical protein
MTPGEEVRTFYRNQGKVETLFQIVEIIAKRICFDHYEKGCEHSDCYALADVITAIKGIV